MASRLPTIIAVPYDSGHRAARMGAGPLHLLDHGLAARLMAPAAAPVDVVEPSGAWRAEIGTAFDLARGIARRVRDAADADRFPIVLSGNCGASLGATAGLASDADDLGVVWLDAHGDLNTPETSGSGFLDGMALAALTGRCWTAMASTIPGFRPIGDRRVLLVGARDLDPGERALLDASALTWTPIEALRASGLTHALRPALAALRAAGVRRGYLHVDVDVHDPALAPANGFPAPGGLSPDDVQAIATLVGEAFRIAGLGISAYDPAHDPDGVTREVVMRLVEAVVARARR
jgi:arginase